MDGLVIDILNASFIKIIFGILWNIYTNYVYILYILYNSFIETNTFITSAVQLNKHKLWLVEIKLTS